MKSRSLLLAVVVMSTPACDDSTPRIEDFSSGPAVRLDRPVPQERPDITLELDEQSRGQLLETLPPPLQALDDEIATLFVNWSPAPGALDPSMSPIAVYVGAPPDRNLGVFLRYGRGPLSDCPASGTPLAEGMAALDAADGVSSGASVRGYYGRSSLEASWDLTDSAFEGLGFYHFKGCVVQRATEVFTGTATNQVQVEVVSRLPDFEVHRAHVFSTGSRRGELFVWVQDRALRADVRGTSLDYTIESSTGVVLNGSTTLNTGSGAFIDVPGSSLRLPADGNEHSVTVRVNAVVGPGGLFVMPPGGIPESDYSNNSETVTWQARRPAVAALEGIRVNENCDQRTPGDWLGRLIISGPGRQWRVVFNELDVDDGRFYPTDPDRRGLAVFGVDHLPLDGTLTMGVAFEDCDRFDCGEEWWEFPWGVGVAFTSAYEDTGWAEADLTPADRTRGSLVEAHPRVPVENRDVCGERPFTAVFRLMEPQRARDEGYEITCGLDATNVFRSGGLSSCR